MIKNVFLAAMSHCDPGYTDFAAEVKKKHIQHIQDVVELCSASESNPPGRKFKWTCEASWTVKEFLAAAAPADKDRFFHFVRSGQIEIAGFFGVLQLELPDVEELIRSCEYSLNLAKSEHFTVQTGIINDVPGIPLGVPEVLGGCGIPYFLWGPNTFRNLVGWTDLPKLFYLCSKSGAKILVWHNGQDRRVAPQDFSGFGSEYGFGDQYLLNPYRTANGIKDDGNLSFAERGVAKETGWAAFQTMLDQLEYERYPYDSILLQCAADNRGPDRELVATVEALNRDYPEFAFIITTPMEFFQYMEGKYQSAIPSFSGVFIDSWSDGVAASANATALYRRCQRAILERENALAVSGTFGLEDVKKGEEIYENLLWYSEHTFGLSGWGDRPKDLLEKSWRDKSAYLRRAQSLLGSSALRSGSVGQSRSMGSEDLENKYYRVRFTPQGHLQSIFDKELNRELIDPESPFPFNGLVYTQITGISKVPPVRGSGKYEPIQSRAVVASPCRRVIGTAAAWVDYEVKDLPMACVGRSTLILHADEKRIDFTHTIRKEETREKEAVYIAFPFHLAKDAFQTRLDMAGNLVTFPDDLLSCSHSDYIGIQNFISIFDDQVAITWVTRDAPLVEIGGIRTFAWAGSGYRPSNAAVLSYVMNNTWPTNFQLWQGGEFTFRYSLTSAGKFDPVQSYRFARRISLPEFSEIPVSPDTMIPVGIHLNQDKSVDLRFLEIAGNNGKGTLIWPKVKSAHLTDLAGNSIELLHIPDTNTIVFPFSKNKLINIRLSI